MAQGGEGLLRHARALRLGVFFRPCGGEGAFFRPARAVDDLEDLHRRHRRRALEEAAVGLGRHARQRADALAGDEDRKSTRLNSSHITISYAVFCLKKKKKTLRLTIMLTIQC